MHANLSSRTLGPPTSLEELAADLEARPPATAGAAAKRLAEAVIDPSSLLPFADFRHCPRESYGRRLVGRGGCFELMVMSWAPGDYSAIHDHGHAEWGAVRYFGAADHVVFSLRRGRLGTARRMTTTVGSVFAVEPSLIHLMGNPGHEPFVSLHLYGLSGPGESITGDARIFDLFEHRIQRTDGGVFFCLPEADVVRREACPAADRETTLLHHRLMLGRVDAVLAAEDDPGLAARADALRREIAELEATA